MKLLLSTSAALTALVLAGCGSTTVIKTVTEPDTTRPSTTTPTATSAAQPRPESLRVGDSVTVDTSDTSLRLKVTEVLDPLDVGEFDEPDSGNRFVGIGLSVRNVGDTSYSDALANGSTLILAGATQASTTTVSGGPCGNGFDADVKIAPGDVRRGCIAFEVPVGKRLRSFQFTGDSGFADETGQWELPAHPVRAATAGSLSWHACDANIAVGPNTTCPFAENVFYEYYGAEQASSVSAYSPALGVFLEATCSSGDPIVCETDDGGAVRFSQAALDAYSPSQAARYAATHETGE
jgi:hypothetical protein